MATSYSPKIVTNGLVLALNAGNPKSYISGSQIWNDLSGNQNNFLINNAVGYSPQFGGELIFSGSSFASGSTIVTQQTGCTVQMMLRSSDTQMVALISQVSATYVGAYNTAALGTFYDANSGTPTYWINDIQSNIPVTTNNYYMLTATNVNFSQWTNFKVGNYPSIEFSLEGNIAWLNIYNRILSPQEISQNFNATRGRFGV